MHTLSSSNPFEQRYASAAMRALFSPQRRYILWRELWLALATVQRNLGLPISSEQLDEMAAHLESINWERVEDLEKKGGHDVMAHLLAYGEQCPKARPIMHWGATSCFVTDNADILLQRQALALIEDKLAKTCFTFARLAVRYADLPCIAFTHLQAAQPTTMGKRLALWLQDLLCDLDEVRKRRLSLRFFGMKGATGTQATMLALLGSKERIDSLEKQIAEYFDFKQLWHITGQTYPRKSDHYLLQGLSGLGVSAHKLCTDLRLLAGFGEITEPRLADQIGSSAMPYKCNPILAERTCGLSRFLIELVGNTAHTAATQWLERSLDDSANRRLVLSQAFLAADSILELLISLAEGLQIQEEAMKFHLNANLPHFATELILTKAVLRGADRQTAHERLRQLARYTSGQELLNEIYQDPLFSLSEEDKESCLDIQQLIGLAPQQALQLIDEIAVPQLALYGYTKDSLYALLPL